ncbi:MAG: outer membrane protein [Allosphingosinicella sp.]|uniref:outer membrane protein n=1 Tax=Allosphingosinicella sp. TaxID=2823234 RepID=UPI00392AC242
MRTFIMGTALLAAAGLGAPLHAQPVAGDWTGFHAGGRIGVSQATGNGSESILFDTDLDGRFGDTVRTGTGADAFSPGFCDRRAVGRSAAEGCRRDRRGTDFAVHAGYDQQYGSFVLGVVAEIGRSGAEDSVTAFSTTPANYVMTRELRENAALRARAGVAMGDTLVYGTGGVAWGRIRNSFSTSNTANSFTARSERGDGWGYRLGGGVEQRLGRNLSIGLQYLYTSLDDDSDFRVRAGGPAPAGNPFLRTNAAGTDFARSSSRFNTHGVHLTTSYRF